MRSRDRDRNNPNDRPTNAQLRRNGVLQFIGVGIFGTWVTAVIFAAVTGTPEGARIAILGGLAALVVWAFVYFRYARKQREKFIIAGGNATGMSLFMFGAMGGDLKEDGTWDWSSPHSSGSGGDYVGGSDSDSGDSAGGDSGGGDGGGGGD